MAFIKLKGSVKTKPVVVIACAVVNAATTLSLPDMLITSANDSVHMQGSKHYSDEALDFRTKHLSASEKQKLVAEVKKRLGPGYDVILETDHLHVEVR